MLPEGFRWYRHMVGGRDFGEATLKLGGEQGFEVAIARLRADGETWVSEVRRYAYPRPHTITRSRSRALYWAERWAAANQEAIWRALREREHANRLKPYRPERMVSDAPNSR